MAEQAQGKTFRYQHYRLFRNATLGMGAYGQVYRAKLDELPCAAKILHPILVDRSDPKNQTNLCKFEQECHFLSEIRHPNIVQYLGMVYDRVTSLPVLLMELMDESLTHFLKRSDTPLPYHVQVDISHDIALALAYLHSNGIIHRDLSSNNVLLIGPGYRAKVTDFGMSKFTEMHCDMIPLTKCPGTQAYMAPEALQEEPLYTAKLDVFQAGVLMVQIITRKFPDPTRANRTIADPQYPTGEILVPVPEIERRHNHLSLISDTHSMVGVIRDCLNNKEKDRPTTQQLCQQLSTLKEATRYSESRQEGEEGGGRGDEGVRERVREVEGREREVEGRERDIQGRLEEVEGREREVEGREREIQGRLEEVGRRETEEDGRHLDQDLPNPPGQPAPVDIDRLVLEIFEHKRTNTRLTWALLAVLLLFSAILIGYSLEATPKNGMSRDASEPFEKETEVQRIKDQLELKEQLILDIETKYLSMEEENKRLTEQNQDLQGQVDSCKNISEKALLSWVFGPGLRSATVNYSTHVTVELRDHSGQPYLVPQKITAQLEAINVSLQRSKTPQKLPVDIAAVFPSQHKISFTAVTRGQHKLHIQHNDSEINGSPFTITVYPDPTQLGTPVRVVTALDNPYGIAINSHGEMVVSEWGAHQVSVLDSTGKVIRRFGSFGDRPEHMAYPKGVAVDRDDNVYVASDHKLQKFSRDGHLIKTVGQEGNKEGEFKYPKGVRLHNSHVYVCDKDNYRIQVFDCELNFIRTIGSCGSGRGEFNNLPVDLDFDAEGSAYIADYGNNRIQALDTSGQFIRQFGHEEGEGRLEGPTAVHIIGQFVYVSDIGHHRIAVYETSGQFVTSFGRLGEGEGEFELPQHITSDHNGFIYVCDWWNKIILI